MLALKILNKYFLIVVGALVFSFVPYACTNKKNFPDPLQAGWDNQSVCEILQDNEHFRALKCTFPPRVGHEKHYHDTHFGYVIVGSRFKIEDSKGVREVDVPSGTDFFNDGIAWHQVLNIGDSTAIFLIIEPK